MRHRLARNKLGRPTDQRIALLRSLTRALFIQGQISTTLTRAKAAVPFIDKIVNLARRGDLAARRLALKILPDKKIIGLVFKKLAKTDKRPGSYCRIIKLGRRTGDAASLARLQLLAEGPEK